MVNTVFLKVRCKDCGAEQVVFERAASDVTCDVCSATLAEARGGRAAIRGEVVEELE